MMMTGSNGIHGWKDNFDLLLPNHLKNTKCNWKSALSSAILQTALQIKATAKWRIFLQMIFSKIFLE